MPVPAIIERPTTKLQPPANWAEDGAGRCGQLFIREEVIAGVPFMQSAWEIEPQELINFLAGAKLVLGISGRTHPVVRMGVAQLPESFEPVLMARKVAHKDGRPRLKVEMIFAEPGDTPKGRRVWCERLIADDPDGFTAALLSATVEVEALARSSGWL